MRDKVEKLIRKVWPTAEIHFREMKFAEPRADNWLVLAPGWHLANLGNGHYNLHLCGDIGGEPFEYHATLVSTSPLSVRSMPQHYNLAVLGPGYPGTPKLCNPGCPGCQKCSVSTFATSCNVCGSNKCTGCLPVSAYKTTMPTAYEILKYLESKITKPIGMASATNFMLHRLTVDEHNWQERIDNALDKINQKIGDRLVPMNPDSKIIHEAGADTAVSCKFGVELAYRATYRAYKITILALVKA